MSSTLQTNRHRYLVDAAPDRPTARSWVLLAFLVAVYACNWMDRYVVTILLEPMKRDLHLSDSAMGFISGFAFSAAYSVAGLAMGRLADRKSRRLMLAGVVGLWSGATMLTSLAQGFTSLIFARFGVAVFESGCSPTAYSLISDSFPARLRARAVSIYSIGIYLGLGAGLLVGGVINDMFGWRKAFLIVGLPGVVLALIAFLWMRDPPRGAYDHGDAPAEPAAKEGDGAAADLRIMVTKPAFVAAALSLGMTCLATGALDGWTPAWLIRSRHFSTSQAGLLSGTLSTVAGIIGTMLVGILCDRLGRRDPRWYFWLPLIGIAVFLPTTQLFFLASGVWVYPLYFLAILGGSTYIAPMFTVGQILLPSRLRAQGAAMMLLILNLVGMGGGIFGTGVLSDILGAHGAPDSLRLAIQLMQLGALLGACTMAFGARHIRKDMAGA